MKRLRSLTFSLVALAASLMATGVSPAHAAAKDGVKWMTIEQALKAQEKNPKPIMMDLYTDWCTWCKRMDAYTFINKKVVKYLNEHYYAVKFNAEGRGKVTYRGSIFEPKKGERTHPFALGVTKNQLSYPTIIFFDKEGGLFQPLPGYKTPAQLLPILKFIGSEAYKTESMEDFMKHYEE